MPTKFEDIRTTVFRLPLAGKLRWGKSSVLSELRHVLVQVTLNDGSRGFAEAPPRPTIYGETAGSVVGIIRDELAPRLIGKDTDQIHLMDEVKNNHTAKGAIDIAMHDALANSQGRSLAEYLGVQAEKIRVSYIMGINDLDAMLQEADRVYKQGVRVLKVKVGRDFAADVQCIQRIKNDLADDLAIYVDANECFTDDNVVSRLSQLADIGVLYCEEPLPVEKIELRSQIRDQSLMPLIADDSAFSVRDLNRELLMNTFDILNIKTARTGYTQSRKMLELAINHNKGVMLGSQASSALGTARTALFAALPGVDHPSELSFFLKAESNIVSTLPCIRDGYMDVKALADVTLDEDLLREATCR